MCPKPTGGGAGYRHCSNFAAGIIALLCFAVILGGAHPATTAPSTGTIEGVAEDAQGQPLPGVRLTLRTVKGRIAKRAISHPDGRYSFAAIAAGDYSISGTKEAFATATAAVAVRAGEHVSTDLTLPAASAGAPSPAAAAAPPAAEPPTPGPAPASAPVEIEEVNIIAKRLEAARAAIEPQIGASTYTVNSQAIEAQPGGANNTLNQVLLQTPGVSQDAESAGGIHVRNEMQPVEFRINGIPLPIGLSYFGQGLSPRFANSFTLITGALPAQYGLSTSGIVDIQTKSGLFVPGGFVSMYGGGYDTLQPSAEYGGSIDGYNYYVSGDFLSTNHGIDGVTPAMTQIHDQSEQVHAFAYLDKIIDGESRVTAIAGLFNGRFQIPDNPATPTFPGITFLNGIPVSTYNPALLDERQNETSQFGVLSYLHSGPEVDFRISAFTKYSTLHFRRDPTLSDIAFNGISQNALLKSFANGMQVDAVGKIADDHTLRSGLFMSGERFTSQTVSSVLVQDGVDPFGNPTFGSTPATSFPSEILASIGKTGWSYSAWLQDEWKITPDLTVNYGARFDAVSQFVVGSQVSPRLNSVWQATPTTILHAGYARLFTPPPFQEGPAENLAQLNDFNGTGLTTSGATPSTLNSPLQIERANLFDVGASQNLFADLKVGVDLYYKFARNGVDFGQFGAPIITIPFNYRIVANRGVELTATYQNGSFSYYGNLAIAQQQAKGITSAQFNFSPDDLAYIDTHSIVTDHSQLMTASSGLSYVWEGTRFSADLLAGTGTRTTRPNGPPNGGSLPSYSQTNLGISHTFELPHVGAIKVRFAVINLFDEIYLLRSSTSLGAFSPAFAPRRTFYAGITKQF
jgi:outer membrane receptor protein involved in Fe transport